MKPKGKHAPPDANRCELREQNRANRRRDRSQERDIPAFPDVDPFLCEYPRLLRAASSDPRSRLRAEERDSLRAHRLQEAAIDAFLSANPGPGRLLTR